MEIQEFLRNVKDFYLENRRDLEWRNEITPYRTVVSELMLQQTQVARVAVKFPIFVDRFPDFESLARAAVADVLQVWQGMGYNRRALYLKKIAETVVEEYHNELPHDVALLETFPGIGFATARSIACFAWNKPEVFIETNIRRVFIHFFFSDRTGVSDKEIMPLVEKTLDKKNPREWYYALMDYGTVLAKTVPNPNRKSTHYTVQSAFEGSERKVRGHIIRILLKEHTVSKEKLSQMIGDERFEKIVNGLVKEGFVKEAGRMYSIV